MRKRPHNNLYTKKYASPAARAYAEESTTETGYPKKSRMRVSKPVNNWRRQYAELQKRKAERRKLKAEKIKIINRELKRRGLI